ncbi:DUF4197 domain-containing protein [Dinghuibacter silviterrae]|uniref:Uncharacterized protein DUF4197 n=1 Tax=Dinghuibacter silviterrae TaxID=1539049 RepID=A0A4R8DHR3_9BACT|nr:DUF4197 domain-containing protein [Dinghuibacter silviterrae]TDW96490.1 uncharacterized protein DUF4197 [Dinghuibacter silviterrae]
MQNGMKYALVLFILLAAPAAQAQILKDVQNAVSGGGGLSQGDVGSALKEALSNGVQKGTTQLSAVDGFFKNAAIKILMPPEAAKVENTLRGMGFGPQVDQAILSMNRAAEDATKSAAQIFLNAITQMTIQDALGLLQGGDTAATHYLRVKTTIALTTSFKPIINTSLQKTDATKYWGDVFNTYNKAPFVKKVNPDLVAYCTRKALDGIFYEISLQEKDIRANPAARTTALLQKVFGSAQASGH